MSEQTPAQQAETLERIANEIHMMPGLDLAGCYESRTAGEIEALRAGAAALRAAVSPQKQDEQQRHDGTTRHPDPSHRGSSRVVPSGADSGQAAVSPQISEDEREEKLRDISPNSTDDAPAERVLSMVSYCASLWENGVRLLGNIRATDMQRAAAEGAHAIRELAKARDDGAVLRSRRRRWITLYKDRAEKLEAELAQVRAAVSGEGTKEKQDYDPCRNACEEILRLSAGWDQDGCIGPTPPLSWESVGRVALDLARYATRKS